jgi:hypothetical protein
MPVVTVDPSEFTRYPLKSAPADPSKEGDEDGYVMLRPLPYGMKLEQRDKSVRNIMHMKAPRRGQKPDEDVKAELETASEWSVWYEMSYCIGEHNLTDKNGVLVDFTRPTTYKSLDPKVGSEIEALLFEINRDEEEESLEDFHKRSITSSAEERTLSAVGSSSQETEKADKSPSGM